MDIIVVGCGKVGGMVLSSLVAEGHNVTGVDISPKVVADVTNTYDVMGVCGSGTDYDTLKGAGVEKAELFIAATESDELNMLSCYIARKMGARHTIARMRNPEYNDHSLSFMKQQLDLSMTLNPEQLAAQEIFHILQIPSALKIETFSRRNFEMVQLRLKPDSVLDGVRLSELRSRYQAKFLICVVQRGEEVIVPYGNFRLQGGDKIGITAQPSEIVKLMRELGLLQKQARSIMILGASRTAYYLAKMLMNVGSSVKIIEKDPQRCQELCQSLPGAMVLQGDGAQQELLLEEGLKETDAFVALTGLDEQNILISIFAASQNVPKVIPKVNRSEMAALAQRLGLDCIISPKRSTAVNVVQYARALSNSMDSKVETLYELMEGKAEALEFVVGADFGHVRIPLKEMQFKPNILIAGIIRGRKPLIPAGDDVILPGDHVIVLAAGQRLQDLSEIFR